MIRKDTLLYKLTQLHWFLLLTIIALAVFGTLVLFSAGSSAHDLETGLLKIDASMAIAHFWRFALMTVVMLVVALLPLPKQMVFASQRASPAPCLVRRC